MDYIQLFIVIGIMFLVTVAYILLRKFVSWAIDDDNRFHKKRGGGLDTNTHKVRKDIALFRLTEGYAWIMVLLIIFIVMLVKDSI